MSQAPAEHIADRYRVLEPLGQGGMGAVYRVMDARSGRELALKRLKLGDERRARLAAELFEREFHTLSELAHPRIIEVYDYGVDDEGAYYTMELLSGQDLRALDNADWKTSCALLRDVASSLAIVHSRRFVHGDLSPRNVRCTTDGRAKLLDFGAMAPMGPTKRVVGTPPLVAPEMSQLQSLDARTDIYSFGALGYRLLTGRHAYPARTFQQLPMLWQSPPPRPSDLADVPEALSDLIMECLQISPNARPRSAGIVMERLCAIASLPLEEHDDVAAAYLTTPKLVGRDLQLVAVRRRLLLLLRGKGSTFVVRGPGGSGRSRFLDACVLEAKLIGAHVVRAAGLDVGHDSYGVARLICNQIFELVPDSAKRAAALYAPTLAHVLDPELVGAEPSPEAPERGKLLSALRDFVFNATRSLKLMIAVDDGEGVDDESASFLVALSHRAKRRSTCVMISLDSATEEHPTFSLLEREAKTVELPLLDETQTEELLRSVFGDTRHSVMVARRIHSVAGGNPRAIMHLCTHLVEQGVARYEAGSFLLPDSLDEQDLPRSIGEALRARIDTLEPDAMELAQVLALTEPSELDAARYSDLLDNRSRAATFRAIDELVRAELLVPAEDRYRFGDAALRSEVEARIPAERKCELHARLARVFEPDGTIPRRAHHLMQSGNPEGAIRVLLAQYLKDPLEPRDPLEDSVPGMIDLLERAAAAATQLSLQAGLRVELLMKTLGASQFLGDRERFLRLAPGLLAQLVRESGLGDHAELDPSMEPGARLTEALTRVQQRYDQAPEAERGLAPIDAIRELSRLCAMYTGVAAATQDISLLDDTPSLEPLVPLSPAIGVMHRFIHAMRLLIEGRATRANAALLEVLERIEQPDRAGLGELYHRSLKLAAVYAVAVNEARLGMPQAIERARMLEDEVGHRVNAHRVHMICALMRGDLEGAELAQRKAELAALQDGGEQRYPGTIARSEMIIYALMDDMNAVKQVTEQLAKAATRFPTWTAAGGVGRCHYLRIRGDFASALEALQPALESAKPARYVEWPVIAAAHVRVLTELGRNDEALELGQQYLDTCVREELFPGYDHVAEASANALLGAGQVEQAVELIDKLIRSAVAQDYRGVLLGRFYELRARAAAAQGNAVEFGDYATLCAQEYRPDRVPALSVRYQRLMRDAERAGVYGQQQSGTRRGDSDRSGLAAENSTALSRLRECVDAASRASCVASVLAEHYDATAVFLYHQRGGDPELLCALPEGQPPHGLHGVVAAYIGSELDLDEVSTMGVDSPAGDDISSIGTGSISGDDGLVDAPELASAPDAEAHPVQLLTHRDGQLTLVAVAVLYVEGPVRRPPFSLIDVLASSLLEA